jgi:two-component sensor histidine kinase
MELGYELVKEQILFRRELKERVFWFIKLRWAAIGAALVGCWVAYLFEQPLPFLPLLVILLFIGLYNLVFLLAGARLDVTAGDPKPFALFAHAQISLDLLALFMVMHFTGGMESPLLIFVIFHIVLAGVLLNQVACFAYGLCVILALGVLVFLDTTGTLPARPVPWGNHLSVLGHENPWLLFVTFGAAILTAAFLITTVVESLRLKGRELLRVSGELDSSNTKLNALYGMVKEMGTHSELQNLMDAATRLGATIMGVKACSIKLLDEQQRVLKFASTYGLSEDYVSKGTVEVEKSPINLKIIQGSFFAIGNIHEKDYFQYPEDIRKEGIASMLCLPLKVEKMILGVFCVYSHETYHFGEPDIEFFSLMTDLTALAIEKLRTDLNKTWFMNKAAHQLRSPLNAIFSMLRVLRNGYLGSVSEQQVETLTRCEKRIEILGALIKDLLKLGAGRAEAGTTTLRPVELTKAIRQIAPLYETQSADKGISIQFQIQEPLPDVLADDSLVDELLTNLISNAVKYTPEGGTVQVSLTKVDRGWLKLEIVDSGIGIPEEDLPRLFTEFFRSENAKAFEEQGTGLGLVIIKEVLDRLRGTIQVRSKVGQGTTFTCLIPTILQP